MRVRLAQCHLEQQRPAKALRILTQVDASGLSQPNQTLYKDVVREAQRLRQEGTIELR